MSEATGPSRVWRAGAAFLRFPLTRIVIATVLILGATLGAQAAVSPWRLGPGAEFSPLAGSLHLAGAVIVCLGAAAGYVVFVRLFERRWPGELSPKAAPRWLPMGFVLGISLLSACVGILWVLGVYRVESIAQTGTWGWVIARGLVGCLLTGVMEETIARGVIFRITEKSLGSWIALAISALLFGLAHLGNPNATLGIAIGLAIQAGILLGAAYMLAGNLWLAIGLHAGWNFMQQAIFGGALSGGEVHAILTASLNGPAWLAGGGFGVEGSVVATALCLAAACVMLRLCYRARKIVPMPRRRAPGVATPMPA